MRQAVIALFCAVALTACAGSNGKGSSTGSALPGTTVIATTAESASAAARRVSISFGQQLKYVDVLAPAGLVHRSMRRHYAGLVTDALLQNWLADPRSAPGKEVSSPWPQSIEVEAVRCPSADRCQVQGYVRYVTSEEMTNGGAFWKRSIRLDLLRERDGWRISHVQEAPWPRRD